MAIVKHIPVKSKNYFLAYEYLTLQFDEKTMQPIRDENGKKIPRQEYLIDCINCKSPETFAYECTEINYAFDKNQNDNDIKAHHYIISFDPKDNEKLTLEKTMELGKEISKRFFYGHQILIAAHPDGHNGSENKHVHIVINSLRKYNIPKEDWMEGAYDWKAGCKHRYSNNFQRELKKYIMDMCKREGLAQVDLLSPAAEKISDKEYRQKQSWEEKQKKNRTHNQNQNQNQKNDTTAAATNTTDSRKKKEKEKTNYVFSSKEPEKAKLRKSIRAAIAQSKNEEEFRRILWDKYKIEVHVSRGKWGYRSVGNTRPTRGRMLGRNYEREYILKELSAVRAVSDVSKAKTEGYKKKIIVENNNKKLQTLNFLIANGYGSIEEVQSKINLSQETITSCQAIYNRKKQELKNINALIHYEGQYFANRKVYMEYIQLPNYRQAKFFQVHQDELVKFADANTAIKKELQKAGLKAMPNLESLKAQKQMLSEEIEKLEDQIADEKQRYEELRNVERNAAAMMGTQEQQASPHKAVRKNDLTL